MKLIQRSFEREEDYWAIRAFLRKVYLLNGRRETSWPAARLDYWRSRSSDIAGDGSLEGGIFLWETEQGDIVAVLNREDDGHAFFQIDPCLRTSRLEGEMLDLAEQRLAATGKRSGRLALAVWTTDGDTLREALLADRGYQRKPEWQHYTRYLDLTYPLREVCAPDGYTVRAMTLDDIPSRSWASWRAFHPDEPDSDYEGHDWYESLLRAPLYRRDLDLVAADESGNVVAFCTVWYDDVTRSGYFEPVGTMPEHQRCGLSTALLHEGMRRLKERGAVQASVGGGGASNPHAEGVYARAFGSDCDSVTGWVKYLGDGLVTE